MQVYLDNSATTRQYDEVTAEMVRMMEEVYGNPSSLHRMGMAAEAAVKNARRKLSAALGAAEEELIFTGGGTEADNMALFGAALARRRRGRRILTTKIEHPAVLSACARLEQNGFQVEQIGVDGKGSVDLAELFQRLDDDVILVSVMWVNNELGTVAPIEEIGKQVRAKGDILFHSDGIQAVGKLPVRLDRLPVDLFTVSGHKIHGPKGIGALYIRKGLHIEPYLLGGGQERGLRSGTENTPGIAGFGVAAERLARTMEERLRRMTRARTRLLEGILAEISDVKVNSPIPVYEHKDAAGAVSSPAILNVSFPGCRGEVLLHALEQQDIFVSTGAACSSKKKGSHVLAAAGLAPEDMESAIRFSFSEFNTEEEMDHVLSVLKKAVTDMRRLKERKGSGVGRQQHQSYSIKQRP